MNSGESGSLETQCLLVPEGQTDMVGCLSGNPNTSECCKWCDGEAGWLAKASGHPEECY